MPTKARACTRQLPHKGGRGNCGPAVGSGGELPNVCGRREPQNRRSGGATARAKWPSESCLVKPWHESHESRTQVNPHRRLGKARNAAHQPTPATKRPTKSPMAQGLCDRKGWRRRKSGFPGVTMNSARNNALSLGDLRRCSHGWRYPFSSLVRSHEGFLN